MLNQLTVRGFKSIRALEDFALGGLNVFVGANGAGKSNFISLFHMVAEMMRQDLRGFVLREHGPDALLFGGRQRTAGMEARFEFGRNAYDFRLEAHGREMLVTRERLTFFGDTRPFERELGSGPEPRLPEEEDDTFAQYILPAVRSWKVYHFHDTSGTAPVRNDQAVRDNERLRVDGGNLGPFLRRLRERHDSDYQEIVRCVRAVAPFFGGLWHREEPGERMELEWVENGASEAIRGPRQMSDGTLRLLCLATLFLQPTHMQPRTILVDEPELGLHPYALGVLSEVIRDARKRRQVIVATQSADLVSALRPEEVVVVRRRGSESVFERPEPARLRHWLEDFRLGDLWKMNVLGGSPWSSE